MINNTIRTLAFDVIARRLSGVVAIFPSVFPDLIGNPVFYLIEILDTGLRWYDVHYENSNAHLLRALHDLSLERIKNSGA